MVITLLSDLAPTASPQTISFNQTTSQSFILSWHPPMHLEQNGVLTLYHVIIMETRILYLDNRTVISQIGRNFNRTYDASGDHMQSIDMLHPSFNYTVRIAAANVVGIGPFSDPITVMTLEDGEYSIK